jgi:G3E family GTPase
VKKQIPAYVLTGFLGSGKTTVLLRMIEVAKAKGMQPIIVMNELGETNVERHLFKDIEMVELLNGCICCTIQDDMRSELEQILHTENKGDILFIEGTGVANPEEIIEALTHPQLIDQVKLQSVISVIDASKYLDYQSRFQSAKEVRELLKQQVTFGSLIVLNKIDLTNDRLLEKVRKKVRSGKSEQTPIVEASNGLIEEEDLFATRFKWEEMNFHHTEKDEHEHHHPHNHSFQAIKVSNVGKVNRVKFEKWLKKHDEKIVRAKGLIQISETPKTYDFQYASKQLQLTPTSRHDELVMIFIGIGLNKEELMNSFREEVVE